MRHFISTLAFTTVLAVSGATTANAAQVSAPVGANVLAALQISNKVPLYFGKFLPATSQGTIYLYSDGTKQCIEVTCLTNDETVSEFEVTGSADATYTISVPSNAILRFGVNELEVEFFRSKFTGLLLQGTDTFKVGGLLFVKANQAPGSYTGSFVVTVEYN